jgi:lambda family phage portal protein
VTFDAHGRIKGYWIRPLKTGHFNSAPVAVYVPARTSWGRQKVVHLFQLRTPGQVRGLSPLTAALTPAQEKSTLGEFTLDAALLQTQYALTIESDLPPSAAMNGLRSSTDDGFSTGPTSTSFDPIGSKLAWYSGSPVNAAPGMINHLAVGDKLKMNRAQTPGDNFQEFDKSLARLAATASGSSVADATGDYSDVNYSASRMANETPYQINMRRRKMITEAFYRAVFEAWLEEALEVGSIELPRGALPFYAAREVYTEALFLGSGRLQPDPLKAAQATKLEIEMGLATLTDALAERGKDFESVLEERRSEREQLREAGLFDINPDGEPDKSDPKDQDDDQLAEQAEMLPVKPVRKRKHD